MALSKSEISYNEFIVCVNSTGTGTDGTGYRYANWDGNGNKSKKITGNDNGMGITRREWDGVKVLTLFLLTSNLP